MSSTEVSTTQTPSTDDVISSTQIRDVLTTPVVSGLDSTTYIGNINTHRKDISLLENIFDIQAAFINIKEKKRDLFSP